MTPGDDFVTLREYYFFGPAVLIQYCTVVAQTRSIRSIRVPGTSSVEFEDEKEQLLTELLYKVRIYWYGNITILYRTRRRDYYYKKNFKKDRDERTILPGVRVGASHNIS